MKMEASWSAQTFRVDGVTPSGARQLPDLPSEDPTRILLTSPSACRGRSVTEGETRFAGGHASYN